MDNICPVCNEISIETYKCGRCGATMVDKGRVEDYLDNYSADMPIEDCEDYCLHLYRCDECGILERKKIMKVII